MNGQTFLDLGNFASTVSLRATKYGRVLTWREGRVYRVQPRALF